MLIKNVIKTHDMCNIRYKNTKCNNKNVALINCIFTLIVHLYMVQYTIAFSRRIKTTN